MVRPRRETCVNITTEVLFPGSQGNGAKMVALG